MRDWNLAKEPIRSCGQHRKHSSPGPQPVVWIEHLHSYPTPKLLHLMGSTAADANAEFGSRPATVPSPSPLSQAISAEGTTGTLPTFTGIDTELPQSAVESPATDEQNSQDSNVGPISSDEPLPDIGKQATSSTILTTQDQETDLAPGTADSGLSGNDSPDARLEKEYHREKEKNDGIKNDDRDKGCSSDENSSSRGRQRNREKKQYRKESNASASDTDGGSAKEITTSSGKKPTPRKLKTFEPLREKEESMSSGHIDCRSID